MGAHHYDIAQWCLGMVVRGEDEPGAAGVRVRSQNAVMLN